MSKIRVLSDNLANQIAAGEVVERPASVIKELVENSIDAGATRLSIEIELGGRRLMKISDNGEGMVRDDAILAFERHATSKIKELDDLGRIGTLGFRGEALASIASVAKVDLVTKIENDLAATQVTIEGGRLVDVKDAARSTGTTISVRDLFFNTPARRKFMRSEATENYHIASIVQHYALAHPELAFSLKNNGRDVMNVSPAKDLRERAFQIFGGSMIESLLPVAGGREYVASVSGFVSAPRERRTNKDSQYFFVNNRFVRDKTIANGLAGGFRSVLPHGVYPVAFLFVDVPLEEIDVNVHPAKTEVRFRRSEAVKDAVTEAIRASLMNAGIVPSLEDRINFEEDTIAVAAASGLNSAPPLSEQSEIMFRHERNNETTEIVSANDFELRAEPDFREVETIVPRPVTEVVLDLFGSTELTDPFIEIEPTEALDKDQKSNAYVEMPPVNSAERFTKAAEVADVSERKVRPVAQLHDSFIIAVDDEGLLLVDQHVAHERILFDKYKNREMDRAIESQNLLLPETIDLTPAQTEAFHLAEEPLAELGFGMMRLSGRTVAIKSIPTDLSPADARNLFAEILDGIGHEKRGEGKSTLRDDIAASLACKAAVKINMKLTPEKMEWLIDRLLLTSSPTTCPHGRPVILRLTMKDIERGFHRT